jgi:hypothetical protein
MSSPTSTRSVFDGLPLGNPPPVISSSPWMPVGDLGSWGRKRFSCLDLYFASDFDFGVDLVTIASNGPDLSHRGPTVVARHQDPPSPRSNPPNTGLASIGAPEDRPIWMEARRSRRWMWRGPMLRSFDHPPLRRLSWTRRETPVRAPGTCMRLLPIALWASSA